MQSKIIQLSSKPIPKNEYINAFDLCEDNEISLWCDYIGDEVEDEKERKDYINELVESMNGVLSLNKDGSITYNGEEPMKKFLKEWTNKLRGLVAGLTKDNILYDFNLFRIKEVCNRTHIESYSRFYIEEWSGEHASLMVDFVEWIKSNLKENNHIYVGAIIDYHW